MSNGPTRTAAVFAIAAAMLLLLFVAKGAAQTPAEKPKPAIELGAPFADNAILQQQMPVPVWGWSKPGATVTVEFAGQKQIATAGKDGKWMLQLDPMAASAEGRELSVQCSGVGVQEGEPETIILTGVLVGEVWFSSGQSNMDWVAGKSMCRELAGELLRQREGDGQPEGHPAESGCPDVRGCGVAVHGSISRTLAPARTRFTVRFPLGHSTNTSALSPAPNASVCQ